MRSLLRVLAGRRPPPLATTAVVVVFLGVALVVVQVLTYSPAPDVPAPLSSPTLNASAFPIETAPQQTDNPIPSDSAPPTVALSGFLTPGVTAAWTGWDTAKPAPTPAIGQVLKWKGGYVASTSSTQFGEITPSVGLWISTDGQSWSPVTSIDAPAVIVSVAPKGLIAIAVNADGTKTPLAVWTSSDGLAWTNAGSPGLPGELISVAGNDKGIVATMAIVAADANSTYSDVVEFSVDGVHWAPVNVDPKLFSSQPGVGLLPHVQSNGSRFFLMGTPGPVASATGIVLAASVSPPDEILWSDDGKKWTQTKGSYSQAADFIDFGRDGMILHTNSHATPGGSGLAVSTDGGKTWKDDSTLAPMGPIVCQGECSTGPDGTFGSNGTVIVAVKSDGRQAWLSYDAHTWSPIPWIGVLNSAGYGGAYGFVVMPTGVIDGGSYVSAH